MRRAELEVGDVVAVVVRGAVRADPYSRVAREAVERATVTVPTPAASTGVMVQIDGTDSARHVRSIRVLCRWSEWVERIEARDAAAADQHDEARGRVEARREALAAAQRISPRAKCEDGWVMIPILDWNEHHG